MLNEDKIKLMTNIAMFEKQEGKYIFPVVRYFKGDYIGHHLLQAFLGYTFCCFLAAALYALYRADDIFATLSMEMVNAVIMKYAVWYAGGLILYLAVTWIVSAKRYGYAMRGLKVYVTKLKRLEKRYEFQSKTRELGREVKRHDSSIRI